MIKLHLVFVGIVLVCAGLHAQVSEKKFEKFKKKYIIDDTHENGYVIRKKGTGFADKELKILVKPEHAILFYDSVSHSVLTGDKGSSINDGGGPITTGYGNLELINLSDNTTKSILEDYQIHFSGYNWRRNKLNGQYHPVVKHRTTGRLNIINTKGDLLLNRDYDQINGVMPGGRLYGLMCEDEGQKCSYELVDLNNKVYYRSEAFYRHERYAEKQLAEALEHSANMKYVITMPTANEFNIVDLETGKELLEKNYSRISLIKDRKKDVPLIFRLHSDARVLSIFDPATGKVHLENFDGSVSYEGMEGQSHKLRCYNRDDLKNYYLLEPGKLKYPVWGKKFYSLEGHVKTVSRIITEKDGVTLYGIYDVKNDKFIVELSPKEIKYKYNVAVKTKKKTYTYYYIEDGKEVRIDLSDYLKK